MTERLTAETVVDGRYRIIDRIGAGGMAEVYCAEDLQLGRQVALKVLYRRLAADVEFVERFRREASSAAGLQHPHVVSVYDRGEWDGTYYIAMELLRGRSLKAVVQQEAPLAPDPAIELTIQVLRAARFAHRRGIIHRDLKPHNVIVDDEGRAKVTDFGIARAGASDMTETGSILGTAQYLSPEQAEGYAVSAQSDLYSIGIILYELLTGRVPFDGESAVTIALKQVSELPVPPSAYNGAVTPELEAVVLRALEKAPQARFADADEFIAALETARARLPAGAVAVPLDAPTTMVEHVPHAFDASFQPAHPLPERERRESPSPWWWALVLALVAAGIVAAVLLIGGGEGVAVPNVIGQQRADAQAQLRAEGFSTDVVPQSSTKAVGTVLDQDPAGGARAEQGATVTLTVSDGPEQVAVPPVRGLTLKSALGRLKRAGLTATQREEVSTDVEEGRIIDVSPQEGTKVDDGSSVQLVVSGGPEQVAVPSVVGEELDAARTTLEDAGFEVRVEEEESDEPAGTVLAQEPAGGGQADDGAIVTLTVAKEPTDVEVPDVTGEAVGDAVQALSRAGFEVDQQERAVDSPEGDGVVIEQTPAGGEAERGSKVTIVVGRFDAAATPGADGTTPEGAAGTATDGAATG